MNNQKCRGFEARPNYGRLRDGQSQWRNRLPPNPEEMVGFVFAWGRRRTTDSSDDEGVGSLRGGPLQLLACHRPGHTRTASGTGGALDLTRGAGAGACPL